MTALSVGLGVGRGQRTELDDPLFGGRVQLRRDRSGESGYGRADVKRFRELGSYVPGPVRSGGKGYGRRRAATVRGREHLGQGRGAREPEAGVQKHHVHRDDTGERAEDIGDLAGPGDRPGRARPADRIQHGRRRRQFPRGQGYRGRVRVRARRPRPGRRREVAISPGRRGRGRRQTRPGDGARRRVRQRDRRERQTAQVRRRRELHRVRARDDARGPSRVRRPRL